MAPQNTPQNGAAPSWTSPQETEATHVSAGYRDALSFVLVPRTSLQFDPPDANAVRLLGSPSELRIPVPIRGKAIHFEPGVTLPCELSWLVQKGTGQPVGVPVGNAVMKVDANGHFQILVDGRTPVVDLLAHKLLNQGMLGYSVLPRFPHAETSEQPPVIRFNNACTLKTKKPEEGNARIGELVTFTPQFAPVLNKADLELRVIELDEGSGEVSSEAGRHAFTHRWSPLAFHTFRSQSSVDWAIGFSDETCEQLADVGNEEEGGYEFGWELWGRSAPDAQPTLLDEDKGFLKVPKPHLEQLRVEYDATWNGTWEVHGKILHVSPRAHLQLDVAVVQPAAPPPQTTPGAIPSLLQAPQPLVNTNPLAGATTAAPGEDTKTETVRVQLGPDGIFEANVGERHWGTNLLAGPPPNPPRGYAILSFVAAARGGKPGPLQPYLNFDDNKYSPYKDDKLSWDVDAPWVCSEEATALSSRPPKPKRRNRGITAIPAPGPEVGDQKTPITFDDMWLDIAAWEGVVAYMYQDTEGWVTVGAGNLLKTLEPAFAGDKLAAKTHPFLNEDAARPATPEEIAEAFRKVKAMPKGLFYTAYAQRPNIYIPDAYSKQLAKERYEKEFLPAVKSGFPDFESYPRAARRGILDVTYNVGTSVPTKWTKLIKAVKARDWTTASVECRTKPQNAEDLRNEWRKSLFLHAARVDWKRPGA
jgi:GH24 family phage-related lysozyme (muramidase)